MNKSCPNKDACFWKAHTTSRKRHVSMFCLGRRIKQPQMDNLYRFSPNLTDSRPMGTLHVALTMRYHGVSKTLSPSKVRTCPFQSPCPPLRHWPRVASPSATLMRGSAQRRISNDQLRGTPLPGGPAEAHFVRNYVQKKYRVYFF